MQFNEMKKEREGKSKKKLFLIFVRNSFENFKFASPEIPLNHLECFFFDKWLRKKAKQKVLSYRVIEKEKF